MILGPEGHPIDKDRSQVAKQNPGNWFNMNPIHCLRSRQRPRAALKVYFPRYLHQHDPPCIFYQIGKDLDPLFRAEKL